MSNLCETASSISPKIRTTIAMSLKTLIRGFKDEYLVWEIMRIGITSIKKIFNPSNKYANDDDGTNTNIDKYK